MSIYFIFVVLFFHFAGHKPQVMNKTADVGLGRIIMFTCVVADRRLKGQSRPSMVFGFARFSRFEGSIEGENQSSVQGNVVRV